MPRGIPRWLEAGTSSHFSYAATPPRISIQSTSTLTAVMDIYADEGIPRTYRIGNFRPVLRLDSPALQALVRANQRALRTLAEQPKLAVDYIAGFLNRVTPDEAKQYYERLRRPVLLRRRSRRPRRGTAGHRRGRGRTWRRGGRCPDRLRRRAFDVKDELPSNRRDQW